MAAIWPSRAMMKSVRRKMTQNQGGSTPIGAARHRPTPRAERLAYIGAQDERPGTHPRCDGSRRGHDMGRSGRNTRRLRGRSRRSFALVEPRNPIRKSLSLFCARAASGQAMADPALTLMKSRRRIAFTKAGTTPNRTRLQQGFATDGMGFSGQVAEQQS
jgi:hypothetical protein